MSIANAATNTKSVGDPLAEYESLQPIWLKCRAACSGERFVKSYDSVLNMKSNLLIPFSPSMTQEQYDFYRLEAEFPGIVAQYAKILVGGLLRKQPVLTLPEGLEDAFDWIMNDFGKDGAPLASFLDESLYEELQTSRAWVYVDHPVVPLDAHPDVVAAAKPYPVMWKAESVINWSVAEKPGGGTYLKRVLVRGLEAVPDENNEFHDKLMDTVRVHEIADGFYQVRVYRASAPKTQAPVVAGKVVHQNTSERFELTETLTNFLIGGERMTVIPAWPLNGMIAPIEPILSPLIDKEIALYNKISRRNHLLYGAATYTPVITADMTDEEFENIVSSGLGTWLRLPAGSTATVLETPTAALADMDRAIVSGIEEMAKLGIRMLTPESDQSGVALEIRNAAQTAQLGTLNTKVSNTIRQIIVFMINWRAKAPILSISDIEFQLSTDFTPTPLGADWLRLATEWYQQGMIPRSIWLQLLKTNDMLSPDYNDKEGMQEIQRDQDLMVAKQQEQYADQIKIEQELQGEDNGNKKK